MSAARSLGFGRALRLLAAPPSVRASSRSCEGPAPPPAPPPCAPHARPPCRPPPPCSDSSAVRVVCCAPPRGRRPPCDPRAPRPHLACSDAKSDATRTRGESGACCGAGQDRVAHRLAAAAAARRRHYELEAQRRARAARPPPAPLAYAPGAARHCLPASDGRTYALPCAPGPAARCGPGRRPPSPRVVRLAREPACRLDAAPDPCAHRPRTIVEVDRELPVEPAAPPAPLTPGPSPAEKQPRGLAERIVAGLRGQPQPPRRRLHTAAECAGTLRAAGRGRETVPCSAPARGSPPPSGRLELAVPAGATRLCVLVSLATGPAPGGGSACAPATEERRPASAPEGRSTAAGGDSWLSIRSLQRKLSGCGRDSSGAPRGPPRPQVAPACPPRRPTPPTPPAAPVPDSAAPRSPCSQPQSPKPSPCNRDGAPKQIKKYSDTLTLVA